MEEILKEFRAVRLTLGEAIEAGLEVEVVVFALKAMKENYVKKEEIKLIKKSTNS